MLDDYALVTEQSSDTFHLYFDVFHKDSLRTPKGLVFSGRLFSTEVLK